MDFRIAVASDYDLSGSSIETAETFGCSEAWVRRLIKRRRETGSLELPPRRTPRDAYKLDDADRERLSTLIKAKPDMTLAELAEALGHKASVPTVWRETRRWDPSQKDPSRRRAGLARCEGGTRRVARAARGRAAGSTGVPLDEFGATTNMTRRYAGGPRGERVMCKTPHGHWKILSTIAAMTVRGMLCSGTFDGATDTDTFVAFVREGLVPALTPGQVVIMDNLPAHRKSTVDELVESVGAS
jgi:transposase